MSAGSNRRDALGWACYWLHLLVMAYIVCGWAWPARWALLFYIGFLPCVVVQWMVNKNACVLNNFESLLRTGRWRDAGNEEEGAWFRTLVRNLVGWTFTPRQMDVVTYCAMAFFWGLGIAHFLRLWHSRS